MLCARLLWAVFPHCTILHPRLIAYLGIAYGWLVFNGTFSTEKAISCHAKKVLPLLPI